MKKIIIALGLVAFASLAGLARDNYSRDASVLPAAAREAIKSNFKGSVSFVKIEKSLGKVSEYEVVLTDGTQVTFDSKGNWKDVEASASKGVPASLVPQTVQAYVKANYKGIKIVGIEKAHSGYEVELSNGLDLKFDTAGNFKRFD